LFRREVDDLYIADEGDETGEMGNFSAKNGEAGDCWCQGLGMPVAFDGLSLEGRLSLPCMQLIEVNAIFRTTGSG
jgi:hypothetical protein